MKELAADRLVSLSKDRLAPTDYVQWLKANGWGSVKDERYMLYDGLVPMREMHNVAPPGYWSFGDDFSGVSGCFSENVDGLVYEWDSGTCEMLCTNLRFPAFISQYAVVP